MSCIDAGCQLRQTSEDHNSPHAVFAPFWLAVNMA